LLFQKGRKGAAILLFSCELTLLGQHMLHRTSHPWAEQWIQSSTRGGCYAKHLSPEELSVYLGAELTGCRNRL